MNIIYSKSLSVLILTFVLFYTFPAVAKSSHGDPCAALAGNWKGIWYALDTNLRWDMSIHAITENDDVLFIARFVEINTNSQHSSTTSKPVPITGLCKDGMLKLTWHDSLTAKSPLLFDSKLTGQVIDNILILEANKRRGVLKKK